MRKEARVAGYTLSWQLTLIPVFWTGNSRMYTDHEGSGGGDPKARLILDPERGSFPEQVEVGRDRQTLRS